VNGYLSGNCYFVKRVGWRWEVWFRFQDGSTDHNSGASEWFACTVKYWRRIDALRAANSLSRAFNSGVWCEGGRHTPAPEPRALGSHPVDKAPVDKSNIEEND
jgi:hypothetical protein